MKVENNDQFLKYTHYFFYMPLYNEIAFRMTGRLGRNCIIQ